MREELKFGIGDGHLLLGRGRSFQNTLGVFLLLAKCRGSFWCGIFQGKMYLWQPSSEAVLPLQLEVSTYWTQGDWPWMVSWFCLVHGASRWAWKKDGASLDETLNGLAESLVMHDFFLFLCFFTDLASSSKDLEEGFIFTCPTVGPRLHAFCA